MKRLRVGVIYGGRSSEHEVSLASAAAIITNLDHTCYEPIAIQIAKDGHWTIEDLHPTADSTADIIQKTHLENSKVMPHKHEAYLPAQPGKETIITIERGQASSAGNSGKDHALVTNLKLDVVFPVVHGPYGEDGTLQGLLELANIPYVGAGVLASAVGMDKDTTKVLLVARHIPIVKHLVVWRKDWLTDHKGTIAAVTNRLSFPLFVKPAGLGSSVGITKATNLKELEVGLNLATEYDQKIVVEKAVPKAREIECAVLGNRRPEASVPGEIVPSHDFYDYDAKYLDEKSQLLIPAPLTDQQSQKIRQLSVDAFLAINGSGMARVDFLMDGNSDQIYVSELNTIPGFTAISMYSKLWTASGLNYSALLDRLIELAFERHTDKQQLRTSFK